MKDAFHPAQSHAGASALKVRMAGEQESDWFDAQNGPEPLFGGGPGGGRSSPPNRGGGWTTAGAAGVGAGLRRAQRPGPVDFLERAPAGGTAQTHRAEAPFPLIDGKGAVSEFGLPVLGGGVAGDVLVCNQPRLFVLLQRLQEQHCFMER
jgi:hypothetical protein